MNKGFKRKVADILDMELVQNRSQMDFKFFLMLMDVFFEDAPPLISDIKQAWNSGKNEKISDLGHKLKGMCANVGARYLKEIAERIEFSGGDNNLANEGNLPEILERAYGETQECLRSYIKEFD